MNLGLGVDGVADAKSLAVLTQRDVVFRDGEHPARPAAWVADGPDDPAPSNPLLVAREHQVGVGRAALLESSEPDPGGEEPGESNWREPRLWIWREGSPANDFGARESVVVAVAGLAGRATVRLICKNGEPQLDRVTMMSRTQAAKNERCVAVGIDLKSYFIRAGHQHAE